LWRPRDRYLNCSFDIKKTNSALNFFQFLVIKSVDPDWIRIRIGIQLKMLDPDPKHGLNPVFFIRNPPLRPVTRVAEPCVVCVSKVERLDLSVASELSGAPPGPKKSRTEEEGTDGDWQAILESSHHLQVCFILSGNRNGYRYLSTNLIS
jgi:hypothetical protein